MEELCRELDDLVVQYCDTLQQLTETRQRIHSAMRQGFYSLSKARNSLGSDRIGALQFDYSHMKAQALIQLRSTEDGQEQSFQLERRRQSGVNTSEVQRTKSTGKSVSNIEDLSALSIDDNDDDVDDDGTELILDPLKWFGILVPQALRQCQSEFVHAIQECSSLATLQNQLVSIKQQYRKLLKEKNIQKDTSGCTEDS